MEHKNGHGGELQRNLQNRHLQLIAIGGAIGTGLFMGSGKTIHLAGPSVLLTYIVIGFFLFFVMRAMGELLLSNLSYKSFTDFVHDILGPGASFFVGWTYWFCWVVIGIADMVGITGYMQFWWPDIPLWLPSLFCILFLTGMNMLTVRLFGELEFWFALVKIVAILGLVLAGAYLVLTGFVNPNTGIQSSLSHLWSRPGGIFPNGISGFFSAFQIAIFAFLGIELVGTAAAETKDPYTNLPAAINRIPVRVIIFYVLSLMVIMTVTPWDEVNPNVSPFVNMFALIGMFSTGRMLFGLSRNGSAPVIFGKLNISGVPAPALLFSCAFLLIGPVLLYYQDSPIMEIFTIVTTISSVGFIFVWVMILLSYIRYRKLRPEQHTQSVYKMPGGVFMAWACMVFLVFAVYLFSRDADTAKGLMYMPVWFGVLGVLYLTKYRRKS